MADERIKQGQQQIWSEMGRIMYFLATGSFLVKCLILHGDLQDCVVEFVVLVGAPVYHMIRSWQLKLSLLPIKGTQGARSRTKQLLTRLLILAVVFTIYWLRSPGLDGMSALLYLITFAASYQGCRMLTISIEKKRAARLEEEYDDGTE